MKLLLLLMTFLPLHVDSGLAASWLSARQAWGLQADVSVVRWCQEDECWAIDYGGGRWIQETREIVIWPDYPLDLVMMHEYGHALGLEHVDRAERVSVMNSGWQKPYGESPTDEDKRQASVIRLAGRIR